MSKIKIRQQVNPLALFYRAPPDPLLWEQVFRRPELPLLLDIGCGRGQWLLNLAASQPERNFLGLEIREPLTEYANQVAAQRGLDNLHFEFCNATLGLNPLFAELPTDILQCVTIQFPDPWYKKKQAKRRVLNADLVETLVQYLKADGTIWVQSDVEFLAQEMFDLLSAHPELQRVENAPHPFDVKTEREISVENRGLKVYRALFAKN